MKNNKLVKEIEIVYIWLFWTLFLILIIYGLFEPRLSPTLIIVSNSFNLFILPYIIGLVYMFRSKKVKQELCRKKSINIATDKITSKLMRMNFWIIGSYFIIAIISNILGFKFIEANIVEAFFLSFMSVAIVVIGVFGISYHLFYVELSLCFKQKK